MRKNISVIKDEKGKKIVVINDIRFKGKEREEWKIIEEYLQKYIGSCVEIMESQRWCILVVIFRMNLRTVKIKRF